MIKAPQQTGVLMKDLNTNSQWDLRDYYSSVANILNTDIEIQLIRNTSVSPTLSNIGQTVYFGSVRIGNGTELVKPTGNATSSTTGSTLSKDPRTLETKDVEASVMRHQVYQFGEKLGGLSFDLDTENGRSLLAMELSTWIVSRRIKKATDLYVEALAAAETVQTSITTEKATATTFAKGAHVEEFDNSSAAMNADQAYNTVANAASQFTRIGMPNAQTNYDKNNKRAIGISPQDMIILMAPEFSATLKSKPGLFASVDGLSELFRNFNIGQVLGYPTKVSNKLPDGVNFMIVTTGMNGALGQQSVGEGYGMIVQRDPSWRFATRGDVIDTFSQGVVYKDFIFVSKNKVSNATANINYNFNSENKNIQAEITETFTKKEKENLEKEVSKLVKQLAKLQKENKNLKNQTESNKSIK